MAYTFNPFDVNALTAKPAIAEERVWNISSLKDLCAKYGWYHTDDVDYLASYEAMLRFAESNNATIDNIYKVAVSIIAHSEFDHEIAYDGGYDAVSYVMQMLANNAVRTHYGVTKG